MNFLAHAYLSFGNSGLTIGNLISDFVKGNKRYDFPTDIQKGITLHREIDSFTDSSEITKEAKEIFRANYRLYSGAFIDVVYDHFLANDINEFSGHSLFDFSQQVYRILDQQIETLPERFQRLYPYMKEQNWLYGYRERKMVAQSFRGLVSRSKYMSESQTAFKLFEEHYESLEMHYQNFFPTVKHYAKQRAELLLAS
ncbi:MAG: ACP phosphodiesterase [Chitinophagaceae bacterium]